VGSRRYTVLDVFTATPLEGNALAVIHDADALDDATMLRVARETRLSETAFVQTSRAEGATYRNRIWTVAGELAFAGHPSLGVAVAVARERGEREARYVQETGAGLQPVDVRVEGEAARASMLQEPPAFGPELPRREVAACVGLSRDDLHPVLPPQVVATGIPQVIAPVRDVAVLRHLRPDLKAVAALLGAHGAVVLYLVAADLGAGTARARSVFPAGEGGEDPATGSAAGPLIAYLDRRSGLTGVEILQGVEMGRPSVLRAEIEGERVRVGGDVVTVVDGTLRL
jgi:trans-2,3-dihydro-3-hydroxyanthranilate isomerase